VAQYCKQSRCAVVD